MDGDEGLDAGVVEIGQSSFGSFFFLKNGNRRRRNESIWFTSNGSCFSVAALDHRADTRSEFHFM